MVSIQSQVSKILTITPGLSLGEVKSKLPDINPGSVKTAYYRVSKSLKQNETSDRITMDLVEKLIISGKTPIPLLRVMTDFLKVKSQDHSELEEIDMDLFYKKAMEE